MVHDSGNILIYLLIRTGLYFTVRLDFIQFRYFFHAFTVIKGSRKLGKEGIYSSDTINEPSSTRRVR